LATDGSAPKDALGGAHVGMVAVAADDAGELGLRRPGSMVDRPTGVAGARRAPGIDRDHDGAGRLRLAMERGQERPLEAPQGIELASAFVGGTSRRRR